MRFGIASIVNAGVLRVCWWCYAIGFGIGVIELLALALTRGCVVTNSSASVVLRICLGCIPPILWINIVWCYFWVLRAFRSPSVRLSARAERVAVTLLCVAVAIPYCLSWTFYLRSGVFPDCDVVRFSLINASMLGKYFVQAEPSTLARATMAMLLVAFACSAVSPSRLVARWLDLCSCSEGAAAHLIAALLLTNAVACALFVTEGQADIQSLSREEAYRHNNVPRRIEFQKRLNPILTLALTWADSDSVRQGEPIPADVLTPRQVASAASHVLDPGRRRNCILIVVESLRADVVHAVQNGMAIMPAVNQLATEGTHFTRFYTQSVHSDYADPAIVSSLYPLRTGRQYFYRAEEPWPKVLLWDLLKPYGYSTAMFSSQNEAWSNMHLFYESRNLDLLSDSRSHPASATFDGDGLFEAWAKDTGLAGKLDDRMTRELAVDWIRQQDRLGHPYSVVINFQSSHIPYRMPGSADIAFRPAKIDFDVSLFGYPVEKTPIVKNAYFNALHYIDQQIDAIVRMVKDEEPPGQTVVVITGDHGEAFNENGEVGHAQSLLETVCRVPLIFWCPGLHDPKRDAYLGQSIDVVPTLAGSLGVPESGAFQGNDLLRNRVIPPARRIVFQHGRTGGVGADSIVSATGWKYCIEHGFDQGVLQFRPTDLKPEANLAEQFPEVAEIMHRTLKTWRAWQIGYYSQARYHELFYAPPTPSMSDADAAILESRATPLIDMRRRGDGN